MLHLALGFLVLRLSAAHQQILARTIFDVLLFVLLPIEALAQVCVEEIFNPPENSRRYSSVFRNDHPGSGYARSMLDSAQAWTAKHKQTGQWVEIDLGKAMNVTGAVTQGRQNHPQWVKKYKVQYSTDKSSWSDVPGDFIGNTDHVSKVKVSFTPVWAQYIRFVVLEWRGGQHISMRAAVYVCQLTSTTTTTTTTTRRSQACVDLFNKEAYKCNWDNNGVNNKDLEHCQHSCLVDASCTGIQWHSADANCNKLRDIACDYGRYLSSGSWRIQSRACFEGSVMASTTTATTTTTQSSQAEVASTKIATTTATRSTQMTSTTITSATTTQSNQATTTILAPEMIKALQGALLLHVSNATTFVQEPKAVLVLEHAIAAMLEINVSWVQNVTVSLLADADRRLSTEELGDFRMQLDSNVRVDFEIVVPTDGREPHVLATVLSDRFERATIAQANDAIEKIMKSGYLSQDYGVLVSFKKLEVTAAPPPPEASTEHSREVGVISKLTILISCFSCIAVVACVWLWRRQGLRLQERYRQARRTSLQPDIAFLEVAGPMGSRTAFELLFPPPIISEIKEYQLQQLLSAMICDAGNDEVDVFISYALARRTQDVEGAGPGLYYVAALLKALYLQGVNCMTSVPGILERQEYLSIVRQRRAPLQKVMLVVETRELFNCRHSLEEILAAEGNSFDIHRVRFDGLSDIGEGCLAEWEDIDSENAFCSLSNRYFSFPSYPERASVTVFESKDSLRELAFEWRLRCDVARSRLSKIATIGNTNSSQNHAEEGSRSLRDLVASGGRQSVSRNHAADDSFAMSLSSASTSTMGDSDNHVQRNASSTCLVGHEDTMERSHTKMRRRSLRRKVHGGNSPEAPAIPAEGATRKNKKKTDSKRTSSQKSNPLSSKQEASFHVTGSDMNFSLSGSGFAKLPSAATWSEQDTQSSSASHLKKQHSGSGRIQRVSATGRKIRQGAPKARIIQSQQREC